MSDLTLHHDDIHIWLTCPEKIQQSDVLNQYRFLLTEDELQKQQRYRFAKDQHNALVTRAFVRTLLSHYADIKAQDWRFVKGEKDKPEIVNPPLPLRFNLSHTEGLIVCAVTLSHDIGIDVENIARNNDVLSIADRYFSPTEVNELFSLPEAQQRSRFFDYWTLKESYIKACGLGLAIPLNHFSFHIGPQNTAYHNPNIQLSFVPERNDNPTNWQSHIFYPSNLHRIALSIRHKQAKNIRWFNNTPLISSSEIHLPL